MLLFAGEVDGAAEGVEHAAIDMGAAERAQLIVERLRVGLAQISHPRDTQVAQVPRNALANPGNAQQVIGRARLHGSRHSWHSFSESIAHSREIPVRYS